MTTTNQQSNLIEFDSAANAIRPDVMPTPAQVSRLKLATENLDPHQKGWLGGQIADTPIEDENPEISDSINDAFEKIKKRLKIPVEEFRKKSEIIKNYGKQKKLSSFFK